MSTALDEYNTIVEKIDNLCSEFMNLAVDGADGRGSNSSSLIARKKSLELTTILKDYRKVSLTNDKDKVNR